MRIRIYWGDYGPSCWIRTKRYELAIRLFDWCVCCFTLGFRGVEDGYYWQVGPISFERTPSEYVENPRRV